MLRRGRRASVAAELRSLQGSGTFCRIRLNLSRRRPPLTWDKSHLISFGIRCNWIGPGGVFEKSEPPQTLSHIVHLTSLAFLRYCHTGRHWVAGTLCSKIGADEDEVVRWCGPGSVSYTHL